MKKKVLKSTLGLPSIILSEIISLLIPSLFGKASSHIVILYIISAVINFVNVFNGNYQHMHLALSLIALIHLSIYSTCSFLPTIFKHPSPISSSNILKTLSPLYILMEKPLFAYIPVIRLMCSSHSLLSVSVHLLLVSF